MGERRIIMSALLKFGQRFAGVIQPTKNLMSFLFSGQRTVTFCLLMAAMTAIVRGQTNYAAQGTEYPIASTNALAGDQVFPSAAINGTSGYVVWQDNITDGDGWGISARRLDGTLSPILSTFRVNSNGTNDQENPKVALLKNGGAAVVWQGGKQSFQHIYARFFRANNTFLTSDVTVSSSTTQYQRDPVLAALTNGTVVFAYGSYNQFSSTSLQDIYFQRMDTNGNKLGSEVLANQTTAFNQRSPAIATLADGRFVVAWVSEQQQSAFHPVSDNTNGVSTTQVGSASVDIYARFFSAAGVALGNEFLVDTNGNICANPSIAAAPDGSFAITWSENNPADPVNSWDISARVYSNTGAAGSIRRVNTYTYGDQYAPTIAANGAGLPGYMIVWTSLMEDGSREGVYGRFMNLNGTFANAEIRVNTTTVSEQMQPTVASDGNGRYLSVWTSFVGINGQFDLMAQRYATSVQPLSAPDAPFVSVISSNTLSVSWPSVAGFTNVAYYEVYADGAGAATAAVASNSWAMTGLAPSSTHSFKLDYVLTDGRQSPLSGATTNTTYGTLMWGGIPFEWMTKYYGNDVSLWPSAGADSDGDGASTLQEFQAGTNPTNATSVLKQQIFTTSQGPFLQWNTEPGLMYQVIFSADLNSWVNFGGPRFAAGHIDSMYVGGNSDGYFRIIRLH